MLKFNTMDNDLLTKIYPETFHTISGIRNGVGDAWGVGSDWVCKCSDCIQIRRNIWERLKNSIGL